MRASTGQCDARSSTLCKSPFPDDACLISAIAAQRGHNHVPRRASSTNTTVPPASAVCTRQTFCRTQRATTDTGAAASHQYRSRCTTIARARRCMYECGSWLLAVTSREAQGHQALHARLRERFSGAHGRREDGIRAEDVNALPVL